MHNTAGTRSISPRRLRTLVIGLLLSSMGWGCGPGPDGDEDETGHAGKALRIDLGSPLVRAPTSHLRILPLEVNIRLSEWFVSDGSAVARISLPRVPLRRSVLSVDGREVGANKGPHSRFTINALSLADGWHRLESQVTAQDGRQAGSTAWFYVRNPSVRIAAVSAPDVVWPGLVVEAFVKTSGPVAQLTAQVPATLGLRTPVVQGQRVGRDRFRVAFTLPHGDELREGRYTIPVRAVGSDGTSLVAHAISLNVLRAPVLSLHSAVGDIRLSALSLRNDRGATTRIIQATPQVTLERGGPSSQLRVVVKGPTQGSQLLLAVQGRGGHLSVPLDGLRAIRKLGDESTYDVPLQTLASTGADSQKAGEPQKNVVWAGVKDPNGLMRASLSPIVTTDLSYVARYSVRGTVHHKYVNASGVTATGKLDGMRVRLIDKTGAEAASGVVAWDGTYLVKIANPTLSNLPYTLELSTQEPEVEVLTDGSTPQPHVYQHPTTFSPAAFKPVDLNITIPQWQAGAFHIFTTMRKGHDWYRKRGMPLTKTRVIWNGGYDPDPTSHYSPSKDEIHLLGTTDDPDQWDDSVMLHELGHRAHQKLSRTDSPGGSHSRLDREVPTLAWSEGLATYLGQTILGSRRYVDRYSTGAVDYNIDDLTGIPLGTGDGTESGDLSESVVAAALWDLDDPVSSSQSDNVEGMQPQILNAFLAMKQTSNLEKGVTDKADFADLVWLTGCNLAKTDKEQMHTLLSVRFNLGWLEAEGFCN